MNSLILDPNKNFVSIQIWYTEEVNEKNGLSKFSFIDSKEKMEKWKDDGYLTQEQFNVAQEAAKGETKPGMPHKSPPDPKKIIQVLRTWWSRMSWKQTNEINAACLKQTTDSDGDVKIDIDAIKYRDMKLRTCLKKWDLTDDSNQEIIVSNSVIDNLIPEFVQALLSNFEKVTEATPEQLKN